MDLPASATVQTVLDLLGISAQETRVAFINGLIRDVDWVLAPGDQLGIFPPVGGG
jgi:molybdopterin converting factor small subunit